jgi:ribosomal protein S18 acetylase RimI-like enzyme
MRGVRPRNSHPETILVLAYRRATPADAITLSVLAMQVFLDTYATNGINIDLAKEATSVYSRRVFEERLADESVEIVLAETTEHLVGFVDLAFATRCPIQDVAGGEVFRLYIQRPCLRRGIGRSLMQHAERMALQHNRAGLWLTAWAGNTSAIAFYNALGYEDVGRTEYVIEGKGYENRVLFKPLANSAALYLPSDRS